MSKHNVGDLIKLVTEEEFDEHKADYIHHAGYGTASGTNVKTITLNPKPTSYKEGMTVAFKNVTQNTGAVTINVNGLGAKSMRKSNGSALVSGNLKAGSIYTVRFNGTNFILQGEGGEYGTALASDVLSPKTIGTENGIVTGTMIDRGTVNQTLTTQGGQYTIPGGKHSGSGKVTTKISNLVAGNIKKGINVGGVAGTYKQKVSYREVKSKEQHTLYYNAPVEFDIIYPAYPEFNVKVIVNSDGTYKLSDIGLWGISKFNEKINDGDYIEPTKNKFESYMSISWGRIFVIYE